MKLIVYSLDYTLPRNGSEGNCLPVANILFAPSRPPTRSPARPAPDFILKASALAL